MLRIGIPATVLAVTAFPKKSQCFSKDLASWPFDPKGMPTVIVPNINNCSNHLFLTGVGMRRKNLFVLEVDVYLIGISFSKEIISKAKEWNRNTKARSSLADLIVKAKGTPENSAKVAASLKFIRAISTTQLVAAFNDAFQGCRIETIELFKKSLKEALGENGVKQGEEIIFYWLDNDVLAIVMNGKVNNVIHSSEVYERLLEVYIDPVRTVSKELPISIADNLKDFDF